MKELISLSASELVKAVQNKTVSARETALTYLEAITNKDSAIGAYNQVFNDYALKQAAKLDAADKSLLPLAGLPLAVKDNMTFQEGYTTCSSRILANFRAPYNATVLEALEKAGAIIIGKTNMDEFAMGSSTENSGFKPTRNPWNASCVPGGSSGGSAAAVAARTCAAALGSDTGGSIRQPAAFCGVAGLKPTYGRVSRYGLIAYGSSLDQIGPLARNITDCALLTRVIAGGDTKDSTSLNLSVPDYLKDLERPPENLTIGLPREFYSDALDGEVHNHIKQAIAVLTAAGARFVEVSLPHSAIHRDQLGNISSYAVACYYIIAMAEASSNLARYDGVHYGYRTDQNVKDIVELYSKSRSGGFGNEVKRRVMLGTYALSSGYYDAYYLKALKVRRLIKEDFDRAFTKCAVLLCPVTPTAAFKFGERHADPLSMYLQDIYTLSLNLSGLPGLALPCGITTGGLPTGMQLIGPALSEELLFKTGRLYERASGICALDPSTYKEAR